MRDRLIELFEKMDKNPDITCPCPDDIDSCKSCQYAIGESGWLCDSNARKVDYLIAHGVTVQEWISVKDRLPIVGCDVLFVCENKSYGVGAYSDTYRNFFSGQFPAKGVTHWMPLPQPPKGE